MRNKENFSNCNLKEAAENMAVEVEIWTDNGPYNNYN